MKEAHKRRKDPRFFDGTVKITGEDGKRREIPKAKIKEYSRIFKIVVPKKNKKQNNRQLPQEQFQ